MILTIIFQAMESKLANLQGADVMINEKFPVWEQAHQWDAYMI